MTDRDAVVPRAFALAALITVTLATLAFSISLAPRAHVPLWLALVTASAVLLALAWLALSRARLDRARWTRWILGGAIALRIGALFAPVSLSDDVYRYVWDGALIADGIDPYAHRPREIVRAGEEDALSRLNSPDYYTVYPPLAQASFAGAVISARALGVDPTTALRVIFVIAELLAIALLARSGRRPSLLVLYAWSPLAYWEIAAGVHTEALMLPFLVLAARERDGLRAGLYLGLAASAKLTALVLLPVLLARLWRRGSVASSMRACGAALLVLLIGFVPFLSADLIPHVRESLALYSETFSFNAPIYYGARWLLGYRQGWNEPNDAVLMPLLAILTLAWIVYLARRQDGSRARLDRGLALSYLGYLVLSRVVHPWYLLVPLLFTRSRAIALFALCSTISYLRYDPLGYESPIVLAIQLAPLALLLRPPIARESEYATAPFERA